ncbi:MAG: hypothetical protein JWO78_1073 [Micavibrio sp.]|nr:hypothetical protein [Micavibrio sp.]
MSSHNHQHKSSFSALTRGLILSAASVLTLAACGGGNGGTVSTSNTNDPPPVSAVATTGDAIAPIDASKIAAASAAESKKATETVQALETLAPIPTPMETFRALAPEQGLKITPLFKDPVTDESARIARVENAVQGMRNDFDTIMPTMVRMASMEKDMRGLIGKLQVMTGEIPPEQNLVQDNPNEAEGEPMPLTQELMNPPEETEELDWSRLDDVVAEDLATLPGVTKVITTTTKTTVTTPDAGEMDVAAPAAHNAPIAGAPAVKAIRIADHTGSTRIVLDMSAKAAVPPASFQNDDRQLVLDLPAINWTAKTEAALKNSGLVSGYKYQDGKLMLNLTKASQLKSQQSLPPEGSSGHRLVLDLQEKA